MSQPSHKKPTELLERMRAATTHEKPEGQENAPPVAALSSAVEPAKRVRYTLDLSKEQHRFLKQFALDADADASAVMRALLSILETDQALAGRAIELVQSEG
jgi:hypothetical protein